MNHIKANWGKYALAGVAVIIAGLGALGYIPPAIVEYLLKLFGGE